MNVYCSQVIKTLKIISKSPSFLYCNLVLILRTLEEVKKCRRDSTKPILIGAPRLERTRDFKLAEIGV